MNEICMKVTPKTIYTDIVGLPDPMLLGVSIHYYNNADEAVYMKIFGSGPSPWSSNAVELGLMNSGTNAYKHLDNFLSRTKPTQATNETLTFILRAYTDSGYSQLKYEFSRTSDIIMIKSDDGTWTQEVLNNFDDGTVQGWSAYDERTSSSVACNVATDYVLSAPYSLKFSLSIGGQTEGRVRFYKSFIIPDKNVIYAIIDVRAGATGYIYSKNLKVQTDTTVLTFIGRPLNTNEVNDYPLNKWLHIVVPLSPNTTIEIRIVFDVYNTSANVYNMYGWLDNFQIISK